MLAGIFQKSASDVLNEPFIINVNDLETDYLYPNLKDCQVLNKKRSQIKNNHEVYKTQNDYTDFLNLLKTKFKDLDDTDNPLFVYEFLDELHSRMV